MRTTNLDSLEEIPNPERTISIYEAVGLTAAIRDERLSIAKTIMRPGTAAERHYHQESEEIYLVLNGSATMVIDDARFSIAAGDVVAIQPREVHQVITGEGEQIEFLAITVPPYRPDDFLIV
jgi:mannose-6-phosphate isomerase-like protein (cupin superfamily)